jgi:hypothetical protein
VDTVEWGAVERSGRRASPLWRAVPRLGALALAALGFALLAAAEFIPWARVEVTAGLGRVDTALNSGLSVTLDRVVSTEAFAFQLGTVALLGTVGYTLASSAARRRVAMGTTLGVAAGEVLLILSVSRSALHAFDTLSGLGTVDRAEAGFNTVTGPGAYVAGAAVLLLSASAVTAGLLQRGGWVEAPEAVPAPPPPTTPPPAVEPIVYGPDGERELTVSPLQPIDESYFARPDQH